MSLASFLLKILAQVMYLQRIWFNLAERNLALGRPASQSSTWGGWDASRVVDGNPDPNANHGSCCNNNDGPGGPNWLMVDLGRYYTIAYVVATNRVDGSSEINRL